MRKYNKNNCDCYVRDVVTDIYERTIVLSGQHAHEWSISICTKTRIYTQYYPNGATARKEFRKLKRKR